MATGTVIPTISPTQFAARLAALFPNGWASPDAAQSGVLQSFLLALGSQLQAVLEQVRYSDSAVLVPTETSPELDFAAQDFYGSALPRPPGMSDVAYANLILSGLFKPATTRAALSNAISDLTGFVPRMIEPWRPSDTGVWDGPASYWDVDSAVTPFLWTGEERATGFIESAPPIPSMGTGGNPVLCWDDGWYWDVAGSSFFDIVLNPTSSLFTLVNRLRAYGVTIGIKVVSGATLVPANPGP